MTVLAARDAIETRFNTQWPLQFAPDPALPIAWQNVHYDPVPGTNFVRFSVLFGQSVVAGLSGNTQLYRMPGTIIVQIFVGHDVGLRDVEGYADKVRAVFINKTFSGVRCRDVEVAHLGPSEMWHQTNVSIPFEYDEQIAT